MVALLEAHPLPTNTDKRGSSFNRSCSISMAAGPSLSSASAPSQAQSIVQLLLVASDAERIRVRACDDLLDQGALSQAL